MNKKLIFMSLCLGILMFAACAPQAEPAPSNSITGIVWQ